MNDLLDVESLSVTVDGHRIVDDVALRVAPGETVALVGESGSGKSLTARAIAGLLPEPVRAEGTVRFEGSSILEGSAREWRRLRGSRISLLMQDPFAMLNPLLTVSAHIRESLPRGAAATEHDVARRLAEVGIDDPSVAGRYPFQLSGGMRQRVALAAAIANDPVLLIADEPTTALDATVQREILLLLQRIQRERGMAILLITHDLRVAFSVCDRVLVMYAGRVLEEGASATVLAEPQHPYTSGLLAALPRMDLAVAPVGMKGSVPRARDVGDRCAFAARCPIVREDCVAERPPLRTIADDHATACLHPGDHPAEVNAPPASAATTVTRSEEPRVLLSVRDLRKSYGSTEILTGVDLDLGVGERVGLVGESGSGKTTIARCLLGLVEPTSGAIVLDGEDVTHPRRLSRAARRMRTRTVQCVFQDPSTSLNPALSIGTTLTEASRPAADDARLSAAELLELVGLPASLAGRRPRDLSGGQKQRVAIARALAPRPRLLICDEPTASLDVSVQALVLELLDRIHEELGTALLFVTHDLAVVRQVTERLLVIHRGVIVESGSTADILRAPTHPYTRTLVGSVPTLTTSGLLPTP